MTGKADLGASVLARAIRAEDEYAGTRVRLPARSGKVRLMLQIDMGLSDAVWPAPQWCAYPALLDFPAPEVLAYPLTEAVRRMASGSYVSKTLEQRSSWIRIERSSLRAMPRSSATIA